MDFIIDTVGETSDEITQGKNSDHNAFLDELFSDYKIPLHHGHDLKVKNKKENPLVNEILDDLHSNLKPSKGHRITESVEESTIRYEVKDILKKSVITPEFENLHTVPPASISEKKLKKLRQQEREKTKGKEWFGLPATELTEEVKRDLEVLQMRSVLDPKHFYKKNDLNVLPKYFQIGKVIDSPLDYYSSRLTKKQRKRTLVDELLADAEFNKYNKRKYKEIIQDKQKTEYKAWRQAKRLKKKR